MATDNKPVNQLRCGNIKATIWENTSENGPFIWTIFSRPFKDQSGAWRVRSRSGLTLTPWSAEPLPWEASGPPGASLRFIFLTSVSCWGSVQLFLMIITTSPSQAPDRIIGRPWHSDHGCDEDDDW